MGVYRVLDELKVKQKTKNDALRGGVICTCSAKLRCNRIKFGASLYSGGSGTRGRRLATNTSMATRATKLRASVCKSLVADANSHFVEQRDALLSIYDCAMVFTETAARFVLHVQRDNGGS